LVVKDMDAEPEQLHAVLAIEPSCRVVVVPGGDLGNQAYLMRTSSCSGVAPRHGPTPPLPSSTQSTCRRFTRDPPGFLYDCLPGKKIVNPANRTAPRSRK